ncbi:MAG TPA: B3/B4 domain-containing protein [Candidatus Azoamicus sp.]
MKINLTLFKSWFEDNIDIELIVNKLTHIGFESFIEKNILNISSPNNRPNSENLLSILNELLKFYKIKQIETNYITDEIETDKIKILIKEKKFCPIYYYTIIKNINNNMDTPLYITEHLDLNDIKKHNFITDILNFSTLITGQPLHAYDKTKIGNKIIIGKSEKNSTINTINNIKINIKKNDFIIYDNKETIISIPGKIGTFSSKIDKNTTSIIIESAYFSENEFENTDIITQSSNIFKNIINLQLIKTSLIYTTNLINSIQKTENKKIIEKIYIKYIPKKKSIKINKSYLLKFIGFDEKKLSLDQIFKNTELTFKTFKKSWQFNIPHHRTDIKIKENI